MKRHLAFVTVTEEDQKLVDFVLFGQSRYHRLSYSVMIAKKYALVYAFYHVNVVCKAFEKLFGC